MENTIFVQIASYRDNQLIPTLLDLHTHAANPQNLHVTVAWQHGPEDTIEDLIKDYAFSIIEHQETFSDEIKKIRKIENDKLIYLSFDGSFIRFIDIHYNDTLGACWARNKIQQYYENEKYTLQLDSHHRFVDNWDTLCIDMVESLRYKSKKPVLTSYVSSFDPENDPAGRINEPWKMDFDRFIPEGAVFFRPSTIDDWRERTEPMMGRFYSGHFAFADGSFAEEVQHDPEYFFHGEEISIGVRAFTHGYDLYHPHKVVAYHEYTRKGRIKVWDDHTTMQKNRGKISLDWVERNNICHKRNRILFGMDGEDPKQIDFGKYGFGIARSLKDFEEYAGMSFKYRSIQQCVLDRKEPSLTWKTYDSEDEWKQSLLRSNDVRILLNKNELKDENGNIPDDYDFWYVGVHDKDYKEISRKDITTEEIYNHLKNDFVDYRFIFLGDINNVPKTFTIWPHTKSKEWMTRIVKPAE
jgi:hypothetical protein